MIVYKATNTRNGKAYIGITCQSLKQRSELPAIAARRANGETFREIAATYNVRTETVFYFCKRHGVSA
jgi:hypothetical protein